MRTGDVVDGLLQAGISFVVTVPDSKFLNLLEALRDDNRLDFTTATNEGEGFAIACGAWLGGKKALMIMESTGLFLASNAIERLSCIHEIPSLLFISFRGGLGDRYWWFNGLAKRTLQLLDALDIQYEIIDNRAETRIGESIQRAQNTVDTRKHPAALLFASELQWLEGTSA